MERATERSGLPKGARDVLFLLARRMDQGSTVIPLQHSPSLNTMARLSGWSKRHIQRFLNLLEELELIIRHRPPKHESQKNHARTAYTVDVPKLLKLARDRQSQEARAMPSTGVGTAGPKATDTTSRELGTGRPEARDITSHSQTLSDQPDQPDPEITLILGLLKVRTGQVISAERAATIRQLLLARPGADSESPAAYIRRVLTTDPTPQRWLPDGQSSPNGKESSQ